MNEAAPAPLLSSEVPANPPPSVQNGDLHDQASFAVSSKLNIDINSDHAATSSSTTLTGEPAVKAPEPSEQHATEQSKKRTRAEGLRNGDFLPPSKKLLRNSTSEPEPADTATPSETAEMKDSKDGSNVLAEPEKSLRTSRTKAKPTQKKSTAKTGRGLACADCKRRKVKCKHNSTKEETTVEAVRTPVSARAGESHKQTRSDVPVSTEPAVQVQGEDIYDLPIEEDPPKKTKARKKAAPKKPIAPPERTSARNRKAPERFEDVQQQPHALISPVKKAPSKVFDPIYITTNSTSRLGKADMYHMLTNDDTAWRSLSAEQQATLISMLPATTETQRLLDKIQAGGTDDTRPQYLKASDIFRTEVAKFQADLTNGHLAKTWQAAAEQAVMERAAGEYDAWKAEEAELWWGQKSK